MFLLSSITKTLKAHLQTTADYESIKDIFGDIEEIVETLRKRIKEDDALAIDNIKKRIETILKHDMKI